MIHASAIHTLSPLRTFGLGIALFFLAGQSTAHHGFGSYTQEFELEGTVTSFYFGKPHPRLFVEDAEGKRWDVWLAAYPRTVYSCFDANVLAVGDHVQVQGFRSTDLHRLEMKSEKVVHKDRLFDFYPPDNPDGANARRVREGPCFYEAGQ
jgi:hypothetical protein